jgi:hypothetical protein
VYVCVQGIKTVSTVKYIGEYRIVGNFRRVQFLRMASLQSFRGLNFADVYDLAHYTLYNRAYFVGLIFADSRLSAKIGPHENFPLYGVIAI